MRYRFAVVTSDDSLETVRRYLPSNYEAVQVGETVVISGRDSAGWTLDGYVLPRLFSGLIAAKELS